MDDSNKDTDKKKKKKITVIVTEKTNSNLIKTNNKQKTECLER